LFCFLNKKKSRKHSRKKKNPGSIPGRKKNPGSIPERIPGKNPSTDLTQFLIKKTLKCLFN
jgi:hypothetical protein